MKNNPWVILTILACATGLAVCKKPGNETKNLLATTTDTLIRYRDSVIPFSQIDIAKNIIYRDSATDYNSLDAVKENLKLDFYEPHQATDTAALRPLVIWMHGGGFEGGSKDVPNDINNCKRFASRGYVVASINYRLGPVMCPVRETITLADLAVTIYRAVQDARYAVRYLKSRWVDGRIDTNYIFFAGLSAGAVSALHLAYMDQDEINLSPYIHTDTLGVLDFGESFNTNSKVKAVIAFAGAIHDINWVEAGDIPAIALHSDLDNQLPVDEGLDSIYHELYLYSGIRVSQRLTSLGIQSAFKRFDENEPVPPFTCATATHGSVVGDSGKSSNLSEEGVRFAFTSLYNFFKPNP